MKVPFGWLAEYVDLSGISPQEVAEKLTMGAFEVEDIQKFGPDIVGPVIIGEILEIGPIPGADRIRLTKVKVDQSAEPLSIVCGAQNIAVGQIVPVALPGSKVINRKDGTPMPITVSTKLGVTSNGMLCSPPELGIVMGESEGILIFDRSAKHKLGEDVKNILFLNEEHVLNVGSRSNRGDALSILGLSREVAALLKRPLKEPSWSLSTQTPTNASTYKIEIVDKSECEFFTIRQIGGLTVSASPPYIARRLEAIDMRPVNNIVDITNYVMHELGQPLHAYNAKAITDHTIRVRRAQPGEKLTTIDAKERELTDEILVIADANKVLGIAGIMGGLESEITNDTTTIALEAASFEAARVRRGTRLLGLSSQSSLRFERGVDVACVSKASDRSAYLLLKHCSNDASKKIDSLTSAGSSERKPVNIGLRKHQIKRLLDIDLKGKEIVDLLAPLGFKAVGSNDPDTIGELKLSIPSFRQKDVSREIDLIEEVCRLYGYDRIVSTMPYSTAAAEPSDDTITLVSQALSGQGLSEAYLSSLVPAETKSSEQSLKYGEQLHFGMQNPDTRVQVLNPLSPEHEVLRQSLLPGLMKTTAYNREHGIKDVWLFEIGRIYEKRNDKRPAKQSQSDGPVKETGVAETLKVSGIMTGYPSLSIWTDVKPAHEDNHEEKVIATNTTVVTEHQHSRIDYYEAKGIIENLFTRLRIDKTSLTFGTATNAPPVMHPSKTAQIFCTPTNLVETNANKPAHPKENIFLGWLGEIHPHHAKELGLDEASYLFELDMEALRTLRQKPAFIPVATSPVVARDLTIDLPVLASHDNLLHASIASCISKAAGPYFKAADLISKFALSRELESFSYRITFQHPDQTLKSEEVDSYLKSVRAALTSAFNASFRM